MRLFCFSDSHQQALPECDPAPDAWLFAGDLYDRPRGFEITDQDIAFRKKVKAWRARNPQPLYAVRGNHDPNDKAGFFSDSQDLTEGRMRLLDDKVILAGLGWVGQHFSDLPSEADLDARCWVVEMGIIPEAPCILLTHYPPYDPTIFPWMLDFEGYYFKCLSKLIQTLNPIAVVAGHVHDQFGKVAKTNGSLIVFPGPRCKLLTIEGSHVSVE